MNDVTYELRIAVRIDHPELRWAGMTRPAPGTVQTEVRRFARARAAVAQMADLLAGGEDFGSEHPVRVEVLAVPPGFGKVRWIRRPLRRAARGGAWAHESDAT